jgi:hypothetical protein
MISKLAVTPVVLFFLFFVAFCTPGLASSLHPGKPILVASPNGKLKAELSATNGDLSYRVTVDGKQVIAPSRLGVLGDDVELGQGVTLGAARRHRASEQYRFFGAHAVAAIRMEIVSCNG